MSQFLPEPQSQPQQGVVFASAPEAAAGDVALMQRVLSAASRNPNLIPPDFMAYLVDYIQTSRLSIPIGQVFGYGKVAMQSVASLDEIPNPVDGQGAILRVGSSPYSQIAMFYDRTYGHWVSQEFPGGGGIAGGSNSTFPCPLSGAVSWQLVHTGGLTMQVKWAGNGDNSAAFNFYGGVYLYFMNFSGSPTSTSATYAEVNGGSGLAEIYLGHDWVSVTADPGNYDLVGVTCYVRSDNPGNAVSLRQSASTIRFIK